MWCDGSTLHHYGTAMRRILLGVSLARRARGIRAMTRRPGVLVPRVVVRIGLLLLRWQVRNVKMTMHMTFSIHWLELQRPL